MKMTPIPLNVIKYLDVETRKEEINKGKDLMTGDVIYIIS